MQAIIRPWRTDLVVSALAEEGIVAVTATRVKGAGAQGGEPLKRLSNQFLK